MFRCLLRPRAKVLGPPKCLPSLASSGSRGIKLSKMMTASAIDSQIPRQVSMYAPFTQQGRKHLVRLAQNDIGVHSELRTVHRLEWRGIVVKLAPRHVVGLFDLRYFSELGNAFVESVVRRCLAHHERPLWFSVSAMGAADNKPIVRGKAKYRFNAALKQALRNAGYDVHGRRLSEEAQQTQRELVGEPAMRRPLGSEIKQLFGSAEIVVRDPRQVHLASFVDLQKYCDRIVRTLEEQLGMTEDGGRVDLGDSDRSSRRRPHGGDYRGGFNRTSGQSGQPGQDRRPRRHF